MDCTYFKGRAAPKNPAALRRVITTYERAIGQAELIGWPLLAQSFRDSLKLLACGIDEPPAPSRTKRKVLDQMAEAEAIAAAARTMSAAVHSSVIGAPSIAARSAPSAA